MKFKYLLALIPLLLLFLFIPKTESAELTTGWYSLSPSSNLTVRLNVDNGKASATSYLKKSNNTSGQKFYVQKQSDGSFKIGTGTTVGISVIGSNKNQQKWSNTAAQKWTIAPSGDYFTIKNKSTGNYLSFNGSTLNVNTIASLWRFQPYSEKYTVTFMDANNKTIKRQSVANGKAATAPTLPSKTGYIAAWDTAFDKVTKNTIVKPKYTAKTVKVTFHNNIPNETEKTYTETYAFNDIKEQYFGMKLGNRSGYFGTWTRTGYTMLGWNKDKNATTSSYSKIYADVTDNWINTNAGSIDLYAVWKLSTYNVTFTDGQGKTLKTQTVTHGNAATAPTAPTRTGYTFAGWDKTFSNVTGNMTVTAKWTAKTAKTTFHINTPDDTRTYTETYTYGAASQSFGMKLGNKSGFFGTWTRTGYTMLGWNTSKTATAKTYDIYSSVTDSWINTNAGSINLYAVWKLNTYNVTFVDGQGKTLKTQTVDYGKSATAPTAPTRTGYDFAGWDKAYSNITGNTTVTAKWNIKKYTVTFRTSSNVMKTETVEHGKAAHPPAASQFPERLIPSDYVVTGWTADNKKYAYNATEIPGITKNTTVTASFWWKGVYYYDVGVLQKGLHKVPTKENPATSKWYIFNDSGKKESEGNDIYIGGFFKSDANTKTRFYITLDGYKFRRVQGAGETEKSKRDMSLLIKNGVFYGAYTGYTYSDTNTTPAHDFEIFKTSYLNGSYGSPNYYAPLGSYYETQNNLSDWNKNGGEFHKWAPEWFEDTNGKTYMFYTSKNIYKTKENKQKTYSHIYRTELFSLEGNKYNSNDTKSRAKFGNTTKMSFDVEPGCGFIDAYVIKNGTKYIMFVKSEYGRGSDRQLVNAIWIYESTDLTNWKKKTTISNISHAERQEFLNSPIIVSGKTLTKDGKNYHRKMYYEGPFCVKIGNTYHLYLDIMNFYEGDYNNNQYSLIVTDYQKDANGKIIYDSNGEAKVSISSYPSMFQHLTSTDLVTWKNEGTVDSAGEGIRHGSLTKVPSDTVTKVQEQFNVGYK